MRSALRRGYYPHQLARLIDNPLRRLLIRPETLADRLPLRRDSRILEVGPGSGHFSRELLRRVPDGRLHLLDLQPEMIAKALRKSGPVPPANLSATAADACAPLPFEPGSFDLVLLVTVLGELPDPARALRGFHEILVPGGMLAVHEHLPDPDIIRPEALRPLVEGAGFRPGPVTGPRWNYTALFERA